MQMKWFAEALALWNADEDHASDAVREVVLSIQAASVRERIAG